MFTHRLLSLLSVQWASVFCQERTLQRAVEHAVAAACCFGRRTISRAICAMDRHLQDWSADYKLYSRSSWEVDKLFSPVLKTYLQRFKKGFVAVAFDDTKTPKSGKKIKSAFWQRDPMSPPFHTNLVWGLRFLQASVLFPFHQEGAHDARGVPLRFRETPAVKKPGKRASQAKLEQYKDAKKKFNLSTEGLRMMREIRSELDQAGGADRSLLITLDGSFCNRTIFRADLDRTKLIARCRKDAKLCFPAESGGRRKYSLDKFTPEQVRKDDSIPWKTTKIYYGGALREMRYKQVHNVVWQRGAGFKRLRLFVIAAQPYKLSPNARVNYREPAYLLCDEIDAPAKNLIQGYFDRWQIEINHREEKDTLGIGQAQVHAEKSVSRHPAFRVAMYSMMLLAAIEVFGPGRTKDFVELPKWRKKAKRPSALDLITLLRKEINEMHFSDVLGKNFPQNLTKFAYT